MHGERIGQLVIFLKLRALRSMSRGVVWDRCLQDERYYDKLHKHCLFEILSAEKPKPARAKKIGITTDPERRWRDAYKDEYRVMIVLCKTDRGVAGALETGLIKEFHLTADNKKPGDDGPRTDKPTYVYFVTSAQDLALAKKPETPEGSDQETSDVESERKPAAVTAPPKKSAQKPASSKFSQPDLAAMAVGAEVVYRMGKDKEWNDIKAHCVYEIKRIQKIEKGGKVGITVDPKRRWVTHKRTTNYCTMVVLAERPNGHAAGDLEAELAGFFHFDENLQPGDDGPKTEKPTFVYYLTRARITDEEEEDDDNTGPEEQLEGISPPRTRSAPDPSPPHTPSPTRTKKAATKKPTAAPRTPKADLDAMRRVRDHTNPRDVTDEDIEVTRRYWKSLGLDISEVDDSPSSISSFERGAAPRRPKTAGKVARRLLEALE